jgi:hypothetical protein
MTSVKLIGIGGNTPAKPADRFRKGDKILWNYGDVSEVTGVVKETAKTITLSLDNNHVRRFNKTRLLACAYGY